MKNSPAHRSKKLSAQQSARLGAYFATGVAASIGASTDAEAAIVFFDVNPNQTITAGQSVIFGDISLGSGAFNLGDTDSPSFMLMFTGGGSTLYNGYGNTSIEWGLNPASEVLKLAYGATISAGAASSWYGSYNDLTRAGSGPWAGGANAYAALRFDAGGGNFHYGWVAIDYGTSPSPYATITGFAFEDQVNTAILAGDQGAPAAVPEPGTWAAAALLAGGATFLRWRRRRDEAQKEAA